jgi:hypothetical protein
MKVLLILVSFISYHSAFADDYFCTEWTKLENISCVFANRFESVWVRKCENPCRANNNHPNCDIDRLCHYQNPNEFQGACSDWIKDELVSCHNPNTGRWEQKWIRACQKNLVTRWCSDNDPNHY